jgi:predicted double-glycine peptidase
MNAPKGSARNTGFRYGKSRQLPMWLRFFRDLYTCKVACGVLLALSFWQAGASAEARPVKSLLEMRRENVVVQEWDVSCGAAALSSLLNFHLGDPVTERDVAKSLVRRAEYVADPMLVRARQGYSLLDLKRHVDSRGHEGIGYGKMSLEDLVEQAPVIVPIDANGYKHFVIFRGVLGKRVLLADPAWGNRTMPIEKFESVWIDYPELGKVGFVVVKQGDNSAAPNRLTPRPEEFLMLR